MKSSSAQHSRVCRAALAALLLLALGDAHAANFSQREGFAAWRERERRAARLPGPAERALLVRHRPRFMLPRDHPGLIDFYRDYVANATLTAGDGTTLAGPLDRGTLNRHVDDPEAVLAHAPPSQDVPPGVVYARVDPVPVPQGRGSLPLTLLTWHAVFRYSGLPAGVSGLGRLVTGLLGDPEDWHQLDHYTAVSLALDREQRPVALMLQQHNYTRTWLLGEGYQLPADGRPVVDVARRSNELFPHRPGAHWRRAVRFADAVGMRYLIGFGDAPMMAARDYTHGEREAGYAVEFLPGDDAFYLFQGYLGVRRVLPGRDGPPGAAYNTVPELKPLTLQLFAGYWREGSRGDLERFQRLAVERGDRAAFSRAQRELFFENLACIRRHGSACR